MLGKDVREDGEIRWKNSITIIKKKEEEEEINFRYWKIRENKRNKEGSDKSLGINFGL